MRIAATQVIFPSVESGDLDAIGRLLDEDPGLVHVRHADPQFTTGRRCSLLRQRDT